MQLRASDLFDLDGMPSSKPAILAWLRRNAVPLKASGQTFTFALSDLPPDVQRAVMMRRVEEAELAQGVRDDAAHDRFLKAPAKMRERALTKAQIAQLIHKAGDGLSWPQKVALVRERFPEEFTSEPTLKRLLRAIEGVDPINWAPALLADHKGRTATAAMSEEAWDAFLKAVSKAFGTWPLESAWQDVKAVQKTFGWDWPSYKTVLRRWHGLTVAEQLTARYGREAAVRMLSQPVKRDKTSIGPLEWVSLDGRTQDFWADYGNGRAVRIVMLALVDVATNYVLDYELAQSENATATVRLIRRTCQRYGIFDRLYTDNGKSFAGHLVAGGAAHRFRNGGRKVDGVKPLGICHHLGIDLRFALPRNAQAKIAERAFATLSRAIDDRPEFAGAHAGHKPGAAPDAKVQPVPIATVADVIRREVARHNAKCGRRGQGMSGRSYQEVFEAGLKLRPVRQPTARQLYLAGLIYTPVAVDRWGRVNVDGWTYGDPDSQEHLLPYHKPNSDVRVLLGRDPDDFGAPALAWNEKGDLICEDIQPVKLGAYGSKDGAREAGRNRKAARDAVRKAEEAVNRMDDARFAEILAAIPTPAGPAPAPAAVVEGHFGGTLDRKRKVAPEAPATVARMPEEFMRNFEKAVGMTPRR